MRSDITVVQENARQRGPVRKSANMWAENGDQERTAGCPPPALAEIGIAIATRGLTQFFPLFR